MLYDKMDSENIVEHKETTKSQSHRLWIGIPNILVTSMVYYMHQLGNIYNFK